MRHDAHPTRRDFLLGVSASSIATSSAAAAGPVVVVVEGREIGAMLARALDAFQDFDPAVRGKRIVIKPNATGFQPYPVTTDPALLRHLIGRLKRSAASTISICDAPSYAGLTAWRVFSRLGYFQLGKEQGVEVVCADPTAGVDHVRVSGPHWRRNQAILTNRVVRRAEVVINVAIPKRHHLADFSCALKNNFGCTSDTFRTRAHSKDEGFLDDCVVEFADAVRPAITIIDARQVLAKHGPGLVQGKSEIKSLDRLIVSTDMVAVDSYCAGLMERVDPTFAKEKRVEAQLGYARSLGLGGGGPARITELQA